MKKNNLKKAYITKKSSDRLHHLNVPVIGLTGGIATGKSSVAKLLEEFGLSVISADGLVKSIYQTKEMIQFIQKNYPEVMSSSQIDFKLLRELAFSNIKVRENLEKVIYAKLPDEFLRAYKEQGKPAVVIYDVPLLFEKGLDSKVDLKVCVYVPKEVQISRLMSRDSVTKEQAEKALLNQMDIEEKKELADIVIENDQTLDFLKENVTRFANKYFE